MTTTLPKGKPFLLIILDGMALNPNERGNAVAAARKPTLDRLFKTCPQTTLTTHGKRVGLPEGQMGNSEVGHLNIGGGRIVQQELTRINASIESGELAALPELGQIVTKLEQAPGSALHLIGLASNGGVHSSLEHLKALAQAAVAKGIHHIFIHAISDGRDRPPTASETEILDLEDSVRSLRDRCAPGQEVSIVSVVGRYYAMDRDNRWERTALAYDLFTLGKGEPYTELRTALEKRHQAGETDEFLKPLVATRPAGSRTPTIQSGDALLFFNFRADRMRQIVSCFTSSSGSTFAHFNREKTVTPSAVVTLTEYDDTLPVEVLFRPQQVRNHFGEAVAANGLTQLRIAETEKYAHVTYFFNGGVEQPSTGEQRVMIPSPRDVATYDLKPEMSAVSVTDTIVQKLNEGRTDVYIINYANCDMVGHTGNFDAAVKAVETVDTCLGRVLEAVEQAGGVAFITADHGNADQMIDYETGAPHTFHTKYPVPFLIFGKEFSTLTLHSGGALCDIAPTACKLLGIPVPKEMTGIPLF
ncbi:MAG: 2,3-bisphosphoglycerate-independent phosphoglycerate mutase [Bdellovibrionota bacterium]